MHVFVALAVIALVAAPAQAQPPTAPDGTCQFAIVGAPPESLTASGPEEILSRLQLISQRDSPVAITRADFTGTTFNVGVGFASMQKAYAIEVANISDTPITELRVAVRVRTGGGEFGGGPIFKGALLPGKTTLLEVRGGRGQVTDPAGQEVQVRLWVESVTLGGCVYRPAVALAAGPAAR
jgi:hypothetical protein